MVLAGSTFIETMATRIGFQARIHASTVRSNSFSKDYSLLTINTELDLPEYESYESLRKHLHIAITQGSEYFGFA